MTRQDHHHLVKLVPLALGGLAFLAGACDAPPEAEPPAAAADADATATTAISQAVGVACLMAPGGSTTCPDGFTPVRNGTTLTCQLDESHDTSCLLGFAHIDQPGTDICRRVFLGQIINLAPLPCPLGFNTVTNPAGPSTRDRCEKMTFVYPEGCLGLTPELGVRCPASGGGVTITATLSTDGDFQCVEVRRPACLPFYELDVNNGEDRCVGPFNSTLDPFCVWPDTRRIDFSGNGDRCVRAGWVAPVPI
jgi:hypothetical protein